MTKKEKFDVAVAAFEALLRNNKLWHEYLRNVCLGKNFDGSQTIYTTWKKWASNTPPYQWITGAFTWEATPQRHNTWRNLDYEWHRCICRKLNE